MAIYFIQDSHTLNVKIGFTEGRPEDRLAALQTGNPSKLILIADFPGDRADEQRLHVRFAAHRVSGEWFKPAPDLFCFVVKELFHWLYPIARQDGYDVGYSDGWDAGSGFEAGLNSDPDGPPCPRCCQPLNCCNGECEPYPVEG